MNSDKPVVAVVEEGDLIDDVHSNRRAAQRFSSLDVPDNHRVVVLSSYSGEELIVVGEAERLDQDLVELKSVDGFQRVEIPNDDFSLEAHMSLLASSDVLSRVGNPDYRDVVVVTSEELLSSRDDVSNHDCGSEREQDVLVVWMKDQSVNDLA